jgi:hypothetical protein
VLLGVLLFALSLRLLSAIIFPNIHHPDEIFQTLEPAHKLWTGSGVVSWEWRDGIRSWLFPGLLFLLMHAELLSPSWSWVLLEISAVLSLVSVSVVLVGYLVGFRQGRLAGALVVGSACAVWPDLVYFGPKTLTEAVAAPFMVIAAYLAQTADYRRAEGGYFGLLGFMLGLCFCLRFHTSPALVIIAAWACRMEWRSRWLPVALGAAAPVLLMGVLDFITWGSPFQSVWKNIWINVVEGRSHIYGTAPPHWYWDRTVDAMGPGIVPVALLFLLGSRTVPLFALSAAIIVLVHIPLAHKEMRFLFPATPFIVITAGVGSVSILQYLRSLYGRLQLPLVAAVLACWAALAASIAARDYFRENLVRGSEVISAMKLARARHDLCGLGLIDVDWWATGGYTHLHRDVPIYLRFHSENQRNYPPDSEDAVRGFNYAITSTHTPISNRFSISRCWGVICLQKRAGICTEVAADEINQILRDTGT